MPTPLEAADLTLIGCYLAILAGIGIVHRRRAARNLVAYYQGDKRLPWYMLGLSNATGMFDISGTMWLVTLCFVYGLKSIWIPWLWPVFNQVFLAVFLSAWLRRSNVLTGAEWIRTRFDNDTGGRLAHVSVVVFAIISVLGFLAYGFVGIGKFIEIFLPWDAVAPLLPVWLPAAYAPQVYGIVFTCFATFYVMVGGMFSIVWADMLQFAIIAIASIVIAAVAMINVSPEVLEAATPAGWSNPFFGWTLDVDWQSLIAEVNSRIRSDGYSLFGVFFMMILFKGILLSLAGPAPNHDMQKILAARSPREAALMSAFVSVALNPIRYLMITGFAVLAIVYYDDLNLVSGGRLDFERILPSAMLQFAPAGLLGLLLAALLAAYMSTFAATLNAASAYLVNDLYRRYVNPRAGNRRLTHVSYAVCVGTALVSVGIGMVVDSINSVLQWLVSGLFGGYAAANVLKWYWWRLNGIGYFSGMLTGIACALVLPLVFAGRFDDVAADILPLYLFPLILAASTVACVAASLATRPESSALLERFYVIVRPWGVWGPVHRAALRREPGLRRNRRFRRDMFNVATGIVAQTCLVAAPIFLVVRDWPSLAATLALFALTAVVLKKTWYEHLEDRPADARDAPA